VSTHLVETQAGMVDGRGRIASAKTRSWLPKPSAQPARLPPHGRSYGRKGACFPLCSGHSILRYVARAPTGGVPSCRFLWHSFRRRRRRRRRRGPSARVWGHA
jgi:hypothetical protein